MRMKGCFAIVTAMAALAFTACAGPSGESYQKYWWSGSLGYFYDTNPSTPDTVFNDVYFPTKSGNFYMEYKAFDGSGWYMYYTITVDEGSFLSAGDDAWFELGLYASGPVLYRWDSARSLAEKTAPAIAAAEADAEKAEVSPEAMRRPAPLSEGREKSGILGSDELSTRGGTIKIEYGRILP